MNAKQEMLDIASSGCIRQHPYYSEVRTADLDRIRAILKTHELVLVDKRPLDPALCGFTLIQSTIHRINGYRMWKKGEISLTRFDNGKGEFEQFHGLIVFPWPATQSDGETLLRLLGVKTEGETG